MRTLNIKRPKSPILGPDGQPMARAYEASSNGRRLGGWDAPALSPNRAVLSELDALQRRSQAAVRNNPWIGNGLGADVANEVGTGITPRSQAPDPEVREALRLAWNDHAAFADADGALNVYGLQALAARARRESGEVFFRARQRRASDGLPVPIQWQALESRYCPATYNTQLRNGNRVTAGIEFNRIGRRVAYWFYRQHPDDGGNLNDLVRVPAEQVYHHFIPMRPGQIRGEPGLVRALVRAYQFDKYDDAEAMRKELRAHYTGVITSPEPVEVSQEDYKYDPITGEPLDYDDDGVPVITSEPGTFPKLGPGEGITLFDGDNNGAGYSDFVRQQLLGIAAGIGVPYQLLTWDFSGINDRVWRAIMNQYIRQIEQQQDLYLIHQVCRPMWNDFVDAAVLGGVVDVPAYGKERTAYQRAEHRAPAWPSIHPLQDAQAKKINKDEGFQARAAIVAQDGWDVEDVDRQRADDMKREQSLGLNQEDTTP